MALGRRRLDPKRKAQFLERLRRERAERAQGYREQALRILPHVRALRAGVFGQDAPGTDGASPGRQPHEQSAGREQLGVVVSVLP